MPAVLIGLFTNVALSLLKKLIGEQVIAEVFAVTSAHVAKMTKNTWDDQIVDSFAKAWGVDPAKIKNLPEVK